MIDGALFEELYRIFPESFSATREYTKHKTVATPWGLEYKEDGTGVSIMAECILDTAQTIAKKYGTDNALNYLATFKRKSVQRQELRNWK